VGRMVEASVARLRRWWPALALAALLIALFPDVFFRGGVISANDILYQYLPFNESAPPGFQRPHNPLLADQPTQFYSARAFLKDQVRRGVWPWWMPNILCGQSFVLNFTAQAFHPMQLLVWLLPQTVGETVYALLKLLGAGLGTFVFLRRRGVVSLAALAAGLAFMACSYNIVWLNHPHSSVATMLPWCLWVVECAYQRRHQPQTLLLSGGVIFYLVLAGGHPNTIVVTLFLVGLYAAYRFLAGSPGEGWAERVRALGLVGGALALGLALGGIFLVPFALARMSGDFSYGNRLGVALLAIPLPLREYLPLLLPLAGGSPVTGDDRHIYNFNENAMFVGVVSLVPHLLAWPWLLKRRDSLFWLGVAAMVVLTLQDATPVAYVVRRMPLLRDNHLQRISLLLQFAVAVGGGIAWHVLALRPADRRHRLLLGVAAACVIAGGLGVTWRAHAARGYGWFALALIASAGAAAALPWISRPRLRASLLAGVCLLLGLELWAAQGGYNGVLRREIAEVRVPPLVRQLQEERAASGWHRITAAERHILTPNSSAWLGLDDIRGYDIPIALRYIGFLRYAFYQGNYPFEVMCCGDLGLTDGGRRRLLELMGVRSLLVAERQGTSKIDLAGARPHVFWAEQLRRTTNDLPRDVEVLRQGGMVADLPAGREPGNGRGQLEERTISVNAVTVTADVTEPGVLVLNEMPIEGWRIRVDGVPATVVPVNVIQTGVWLESGRHAVEFYFRPRGALAGGIMSLGGLAAMCALTIGLWRSGARRGAARA
jgi:hypothetical protein